MREEQERSQGYRSHAYIVARLGSLVLEKIVTLSLDVLSFVSILRTMTNRTAAKRTLTPRQYDHLVATAQVLLNTLGFMADEHLRHKMNSDNEAIRRSQTAVEAQWRACCAAVADVAYWSDLDDADHAETIALLREHLHADECALGLGSAAVKAVA